VKGIIHIGANSGQEAHGYHARGVMDVLWIEPHPDVFPLLLENIKKFDGQIAVQALVTDKDDAEYDFNCSMNSGHSSSIYDFHLHQKMFPGISMAKKIKIKSKTLPTILKENNISMDRYDSLVIDVQGAELLVLKGAAAILNCFESINLEAADFESYKGQCLLKDVDEFMHEHGFQRDKIYKMWGHPNGKTIVKIEEGDYYDVTYRRCKKDCVLDER
jgi:FkbM family methyltransferase